MSSRRVFSSQGSSPLDSLKVVTGGGAVKVEYDRSIRANALSFAGEVSQCKIQIPRDVGKGSLSSWPVVAFVVFLSGSDLQIEIDTVASMSLVQLSATGAQVSQPVLRKMSQKISLATFHLDKEREGAGGKGVCKLALNVSRGQWCVVALDMAVILSDYCASVAANESQSSASASSAPNVHFGARSRPGPPNLFSKTPRFAATVAGLALDRIVLSGAAKMKEIIVASDLLTADTCTKDLRLPLVLLPETPAGSGAMSGVGVGVGGLQLGANGMGLVGASLQPSVAGGPSIAVVGTNANGNGRAFSKGESNSLAQQQSTPLRSILVQQQGLSSSNDLLGAKGSANASAGRPLFQVKFTRDADGKVAVAAKDLELERRIQEEKEAEELAKEMEASRLQVEAVLAREEAENSYRRLIEPEAPTLVDRFGVAKPSAAERAAAAAAARSAAAADPLIGGLGAWSDDVDAVLLPLSPQKRKGPSNSPSTSSNNNANNKKQQNSDVSAPQGQGQGQGQGQPAHKRISYLPQRKPFFRSKLGEPCPEVPPLPPAPSSLLLTSVMKRPLTAQHAADGVRMVRTPPAGTTRGGQGDAGVTANSVFTGRIVGYGVGCLDILHCGSDDEGETTEDDDEDTDDDDDDDDEDEDE